MHVVVPDPALQNGGCASYTHILGLPHLADVPSRLCALGAGLRSAGLGSCSAVTGVRTYTRTGVVPHLMRTSLLRVVNAFGHRHVWGLCRSALLSTSPPSVVTTSLPIRRSILKLRISKNKTRTPAEPRPIHHQFHHAHHCIHRQLQVPGRPYGGHCDHLMV